LAYFIILYILENLNENTNISNVLNKENSIPYVPRKYDRDVVKEMQ